MDARLRKPILITILVLFIFLVAVLLALFVRPKASPTPEPQQPAVTAPVAPALTLSERQEQESRASSATLQAQAKMFAERYGSFSTEADYQNLKDLLPIMTDAFAAQTSAFILTVPKATEYYGVTTRVVAVKTDALDEAAGTASMTLGTQRQETKGTAAPTVKYQNLVLTFKKVGTEWKASSAVWL